MFRFVIINIIRFLTVVMLLNFLDVNYNIDFCGKMTICLFGCLWTFLTIIEDYNDKKRAVYNALDVAFSCVSTVLYYEEGFDKTRIEKFFIKLDNFACNILTSDNNNSISENTED